MKSRAPKYLSDRNYDLVDRLREYANKAGRSMSDIALAWLAAQPGVSSIIAGARRPEQINLNVKAADLQLSGDDLEELDRLTAQS